MKMNQLLIVAGFGLTGFGIFGATAHAATGYDYNQTITKDAVATQTMQVYKVRAGASEAQNRFFKDGYIHKGTHFKTSEWIMSTGGGYVVEYAKHHANKHYFYFVVANDNKQWFK